MQSLRNSLNFPPDHFEDDEYKIPSIESKSQFDCEKKKAIPTDQVDRRRGRIQRALGIYQTSRHDLPKVENEVDQKSIIDQFV
jgi:hypothetical protein